ncbi:MAG TPA: copper chaperone PCu(A)C [Stellaceae bacterium]|nr:copper chaperone PCu(A)C [Stellaceae bacterium]
MRRRLLLAAPLALLAPRRAWAHSYKLGNIEIGHPWARPSVTGAAAVFLAMSNLGRSTERLIGGTTPIAKDVLLRDEDGGPLEYLELLPHHPLALRPGRRYIALLGLKGPLALDDSFPLTLRFDHAGEVTVTVMVEDRPEEG